MSTILANPYEDWKVNLPVYDHDGVVIKQFYVSEHEAAFSKLRAAINPQRSDRSVYEGTYTMIAVDGELWMSDTPAEVVDHLGVDRMMRVMKWRAKPPLNVLIVGLGLGMVLNRAIAVHEVTRVDVVEIDQRVIDAVGPHFTALAAEHGVELHIHHADIHQWRPKDLYWDVVWLDIWPHIDSDDMPEVTRLRRRFRKRSLWLGAWAQEERIAQARRIRNQTGWY